MTYQSLTPHHIAVRNELLKLQRLGGAMIKPLALHELTLLMLRGTEDESNTALVKAITDTYCALCNEYYIVCYSSSDPKEEFVVPEERWQKYCLNQKTRQKTFEYLQCWGFVECNDRISTEGIPYTTYKIELKRLIKAREEVEVLRDQKKVAKRNS